MVSGGEVAGKPKSQKVKGLRVVWHLEKAGRQTGPATPTENYGRSMIEGSGGRARPEIQTLRTVMPGWV